MGWTHSWAAARRAGFGWLWVTMSLTVASHAASQQHALAPLMPEAEEVALARSAAPPAIADSATVYVLRRGGFQKLIDGGNHYTCVVLRDHPNSLYPGCFDEEASRSVLRVEMFAQSLREQGVAESEVQARVAAALSAGELARPRRPAVHYMMSHRQRIYSSPTGQLVGIWHPHIMIHLPAGTAADDFAVPASLGGTLIQANVEYGTTQIVVLTHMWSDGTADPAPAGG